MEALVETNLHIEEAAAAWVARRESGAWQAGDQLALDAWLNVSTAHRVAFLRLHAAWERLDGIGSLGRPVGSETMETSTEPELTFPQTGISLYLTTRNRRSLLYSAATVAFACTVGIAWYVASNRGTSYETRVGEIATVALDDGTAVVIDSATQMTFRMNGRERRVELKGGGIFLNVARDSARPFVVDVGKRHLTDEGTQFSVRLENDELVAVVAEGRVRMDSMGSEKASEVHINAGSEAHAFGTRVDVSPISESRMQELLSWRTGQLIFRNTALPEVIMEFNRYSDRKLVIQSASLSNVRIGGSFRATDVDGFLTLLKRGFPVDVEEGIAQINLTHR